MFTRREGGLGTRRLYVGFTARTCLSGLSCLRAGASRRHRDPAPSAVDGTGTRLSRRGSSCAAGLPGLVWLSQQTSTGFGPFTFSTWSGSRADPFKYVRGSMYSGPFAGPGQCDSRATPGLRCKECQMMVS